MYNYTKQTCRERCTKFHPEPLADAAKSAFLTEHIPYRIELLLLGKGSCPAGDTRTSAIVEAGLTSGRILLEFLGLGIETIPSLRLVEKRNYLERPKGQTDEVKVFDVGGSFVDLSKLSDENKCLLATFHHGASKACAHFTWESGHGLNVDTIHRASQLIHELLSQHCPLTSRQN